MLVNENIQRFLCTEIKFQVAKEAIVYGDMTLEKGSRQERITAKIFSCTTHLDAHDQ